MGDRKTASMTILVVDDEEVDRTTVSSVLRAEGYTVVEADSYSGAMATCDLNRNRITFLVADVSLPDGNGCALAISMQKEIPDLRVLFISGHVGAEVCKYYGLEVPALHFLKKPFEGVELAKRVRTISAWNEPFPRLFLPKTSTASGKGHQTGQ
jgi:two-component system, cell cycle sensor histidine kinase and response regulator CckA